MGDAETAAKVDYREVGMAALLLLPATVLRAWLWSTLYTWFVVPTLHTPPVSTRQAIGIVLLVKAMRPGLEENRKSLGRVILTLVVDTAMWFGLALIVHYWLGV